MRLRADLQLFSSYLFLIGTLTVAISLGAGYSFREHLLGTLETDLLSELRLSGVAYEALSDTPPDSVAGLLGAVTGHHITIISSAGIVMGESGVPADALPGDDYGNRPEVRMALSEGRGRAVRFNTELNEDYLYVATPLPDGYVLRTAVSLVDVEAAVRSLRRRILVSGSVALLVAVFFSLGYSILVTRPLRRTAEVARSLGAGDLSRRVVGVHDNEVGELGSALNTLAAELQRRLGQLEGERAEMQALIDSMSEGVVAFDATGALRRSNPAARQLFSLGPKPEGIPPEAVSRRPEFLSLVGRALKGQPVAPVELMGEGQHLLGSAHPLPRGGAVLVFLDVSELRRLEDVRRDFVANASHELKTPLTVLRGYSETLLDPDLPPELARKFIETVKANADRLQRIVDDLLDLSRIEAGGWRVQPVSVDLEDLVHAVRDAGIPFAGEGEVDLAVDLAPGQDKLFADPGAVRQILVNLLGNAFRYTPSGGRVTVRTRAVGSGGRRSSVLEARLPRDQSWTVVEVSDTGSGIGRAHLARIFERFYRVDPARSREAGGIRRGGVKPVIITAIVAIPCDSRLWQSLW
ncbi:MAG: HAMP domain-containing protein [Gemmatimonadota bacterium]|nr:HAMP domain-containing protein [Gemmatimonadota bacterium]